MAPMAGRSRLTLFPLLHLWETGSYCVLGYTTADNGLTAVLGVIPVEGNVHEPGDLFGVAGRHGFVGEWKGTHEQRCGCWLACTGYSSRTVMKPGSIDVPEAAWALDMARTVELDSAYYGHRRVAAGRLTLEDAVLADRARSLLHHPLVTA